MYLCKIDIIKQFSISMNILVIRFRQMGDSIIATSLLNTLRNNFPDAKIDFVLNEGLAKLFEYDPSINRVITFSDKERHHTLLYLSKIWRAVHSTHYDVIIDMRSTINTMFFSLFSLNTPYRIGIIKKYTRFIYNYRIPDNINNEYIVQYNLRFVQPLNALKTITNVSQISLHISSERLKTFRLYMQQNGIDFSSPIMMVGVTSKLSHKSWDESNMIWLIKQFIQKYPNVQLIFNYAPGVEEETARRIYKIINSSKIFIDIKAHNQLELVAMSSLVTFYFGNEGGTRHIIQAVGKPSYVIVSPNVIKNVWLPVGDKASEGIEAEDIVPRNKLLLMTYEEQYKVITKEIVWDNLQRFAERYINEFLKNYN